MPIKRRFANLRAEMTRQGYTIRSFAKVLGMSESSLSGRLCGFRPFYLTDILQICNILNKSFEELFMENHVND